MAPFELPGSVDGGNTRPDTTVSGLFAADHEIAVTIGSDHDILIARRHGRAFVSQLGFSSADATVIATAVSELARNILMHAQRGVIVLGIVRSDERLGVLIVARDQGPGIPEAQQAAIVGSPQRAGGALTLCAIKRLMDEFEIVSKLGQGTTVIIKKWMS